MRRVIDDTHLEEVVEEIQSIIKNMPSDEVSEYEYGTYRAQTKKIVEYIFDHITIPVKLGENKNTTGIGNNWQKELIWIGDPKEEQICGILCLINDMYGSIFFYIKNIDNQLVSNKRKIRGVNPRSEYDRAFRFSGWNED